MSAISDEEHESLTFDWLRLNMNQHKQNTHIWHNASMPANNTNVLFNNTDIPAYTNRLTYTDWAVLNVAVGRSKRASTRNIFYTTKHRPAEHFSKVQQIKTTWFRCSGEVCTPVHSVRLYFKNLLRADWFTLTSHWLVHCNVSLCDTSSSNWRPAAQTWDQQLRPWMWLKTQSLKSEPDHSDYYF